MSAQNVIWEAAHFVMAKLWWWGNRAKWNDAPELIHMDKVDKDMTDKDKMDKDKVEFLVLSRGPF